MTATFGDVTRDYYTVDGATLQEVYDVLSTRDEAGSAVWVPNLATAFDDGGLVTSATVTVGLTITMPQWSGYSAASAAAKAEWDRWYAALEAHEQGHISLARQHLENSDAGLVGLAEADARTTFQATCDALQTASNAYDDQTKNGRNTGTIMQVDADVPAEGDTGETTEEETEEPG